MEDMRCPKFQFHDFAARQGWLLLFDKVENEESLVSYLLPIGLTILIHFDSIGNFRNMTDTSNAVVSFNDSDRLQIAEDEDD